VHPAWQDVRTASRINKTDAEVKAVVLNGVEVRV